MLNIMSYLDIYCSRPDLFVYHGYVNIVYTGLCVMDLDGTPEVKYVGRYLTETITISTIFACFTYEKKKQLNNLWAYLKTNVRTKPPRRPLRNIYDFEWKI